MTIATRRALIAAVATVAGVAGHLLGATTGRVVPTYQLVLLVVAAAVTELMPIRTSRGRPVPTSIAVISIGALLGVEAPLLVVLAACGWGLARVVGRVGSPIALLERVGAASLLAGLTAFGHLYGPTWQAPSEPAVQLDLLSAAYVVAFLVAGLPALGATARPASGRWLRRVSDEVSATWQADLAVAATALTGALSAGVLGPWTLPSVLVPLLAARIGLERFAGVASAYEQTIRAMSRLPEQLGRVPADHGVRTGQLASEVARRLGFDAPAVRDVERAAYLHELGHLGPEPEDRPSPAELATAGARVIATAGDLDRVAAIVGVHGRMPLPANAAGVVDRGAAIVAACCFVEPDADHLVGIDARRRATVELVRRGVDLEVVQAVFATLERRRASAGAARVRSSAS